MKYLTKLTQELQQAQTTMTMTKVWLETMEIASYTNWKKENEKDRTAMDKVVAVLKLEDKEWQEKELEYKQAKLTYENLKLVYNVVVKLLDRPEYSEEQVEEFIKNNVEVA